MSNRSRTRVRWLAPLAALQLLCLPLRAAEAPPPPEADSPAAPEQPAPEQAGPAPPASSGNQAPPKATAPEEEEKVSLDNNLTFPVDI